MQVRFSKEWMRNTDLRTWEPAWTLIRWAHVTLDGHTDEVPRTVDCLYDVHGVAQVVAYHWAVTYDEAQAARDHVQTLKWAAPPHPRGKPRGKRSA
jgi:hypothetical protein